MHGKIIVKLVQNKTIITVKPIRYFKNKINIYKLNN